MFLHKTSLDAHKSLDTTDAKILIYIIYTLSHKYTNLL